MNKERIEKIIKELEKNNIEYEIVNNDYNLLNDYKIKMYELGDIPNYFLIEELQNRIDKALEIVDNINKQYEEIPDKDLITNRVVDISVIQEIEKRLKGEE